MKKLSTIKICDIKTKTGTGHAKKMFLCSSSFDNRCQSISQQFSKKDFDCVIIAQYQSDQSQVKRNLDGITSRFENSEKMLLNIGDPIFSADSIKTCLSVALEQEVSYDILFDITCFTRESLLMVLAYLKTINMRQHKLSFVYSHAKEYKVPLSKGIKEVRSVLGFSGILHPARKTHLIILAGYEDLRAISIIQDFEPQYVSIAVGSKTQPRNHYSTAKATFDSLIQRIPNVNKFEFDAYDPVATSKAIKKQESLFADINVVIAPMNTKISTVGAALYATENPDSQLCYAAAESYCLDCVIAGDECTFFELPELFESEKS